MRLYNLQNIVIPCFKEKEADTLQAFFELVGIKVKMRILDINLFSKVLKNLTMDFQTLINIFLIFLELSGISNKNNTFDTYLLSKVLDSIDTEDPKLDLKTLNECLKEEYFDELYDEAFDKIFTVFSTYQLEDIMHIIKYRLSWKYSKEMKQKLWDAIMEFRKIYFGENGKNIYIASAMLECLSLYSSVWYIKDGYELVFDEILSDILRDLEKEYDDFISLKINLLNCFAEINRYNKMSMIASDLTPLKLDTEEKEKLHSTIFKCMSNLSHYYLNNNELITCGNQLIRIKKSIKNLVLLGDAYRLKAIRIHNTTFKNISSSDPRYKKLEKEIDTYQSKAIDSYNEAVYLFAHNELDTIFDIKAVVEAKQHLLYLLFDKSDDYSNRVRATKYDAFIKNLKNDKYLKMVEEQLGKEDAKKWLEKITAPIY